MFNFAVGFVAGFLIGGAGVTSIVAWVKAEFATVKSIKGK